MSLFQCDNCGCCENTALSLRGHREWGSERDSFDWSGKEHLRGKQICSACGPERFSDGAVNEYGGEWHNQFERRFLPKGKFKTNQQGNLEHIESGDTDYRRYSLDIQEEFGK